MKKLILLLLICSCNGKKNKLNDNEIVWLTPYNLGDTLIFVSEQSEIDTSFIIEKKIYYSDYQPNGIVPIYVPQIGEINYYNSKLSNANKKESIIKIVKTYPNKQAVVIINYLNSLLISDYDSQIPIDTPIILGGILYNDIWLISQKDSLWQPNDQLKIKIKPKKLFWSKSKGLVEYVTYNGTKWKLEKKINRR